MDWPVNVAIIKSPINWVIVFLMIVFAIFIAESLGKYFTSLQSGDN